MFRITLVALVTLVGLNAASVARADVLLIDRIARASNVDRPGNGMSMTEVESRFGAPEERLAPVGEPPITRWNYSQFSVYFEFDKVISSVAKRSAELEQGPRNP